MKKSRCNRDFLFLWNMDNTEFLHGLFGLSELG